jgi:mycoredoxin
MPFPKITVYGTDWCGDCFRARRFLKKHAVPYSFVNIDKNKQGERFVLKTNRGQRSVPTIIFEDGSIIVEPSNQELAVKLGISGDLTTF